MKSFETWTLEDLDDIFEIKQISESELLTAWTSSKKEISEIEKKNIENLRLILKENINSWNEDELKFHFISPFIHLVNFINKKYKSFTQRILKTTINDLEVSGKVDYMVASGKQKPKTPYFFLHEYKPSRKAINDPDGQLLIAMFVAQTVNNNNKPMYGIVVEGKFWNFVILDNKNFIISDSFDATTTDIYDIFAILCKTKDYIEEMIKE